MDFPLILAADETARLVAMDVLPTDDSQKYEWDVAHQGIVKGLYTPQGFVTTAVEGMRVGVVLDSTTFYAESGGQVADRGLIEVGGTVVDVSDVQVFAGFVLHIGVVKSGSLTVGTAVSVNVDYERRRKIAPNHTMTHVLNHALLKILGDGVSQKVTRLRLFITCGVDPRDISQGRILIFISRVHKLTRRSFGSILATGKLLLKSKFVRSRHSFR